MEITDLNSIFTIAADNPAAMAVIRSNSPAPAL
jgi:hypothetical protein